MQNVSRLTLGNGVRVVIQERPGTHSAAIELTVARGSRHEPESIGGATHFCEHLLFKGTPTRTLDDIAREISLEGGYMNAHTTNDLVKIFTRVAVDDLEDALSLIVDLMLESSFPHSEVERERGVILEEIAESNDLPDDLCHTEFLEVLFDPHPLGRPILGQREVIRGVTREELFRYWHHICQPSNMVLSIAGGVDARRVADMADRMLGKLAGTAESPATTDAGKPGMTRRRLIHRDIEQAHFCVGWPGIAYNDPRRLEFLLFDQIFGGSMSSRLFSEVREKRGLAYTIGSSLAGMTHEGFLMAYGSTTASNLAEVLKVVRDEFERFLAEGPTPAELEMVKRQYSRGLLIASESNAFHASWNSDREVYGLRWWTEKELVDRVNAMTSDDMLRALRSIIAEGIEPTIVAVGPLDDSVLEVG